MVKSQNNTKTKNLTSYFIRYLLKSLETILKLNLFKEINIDLRHNVYTSSCYILIYSIISTHVPLTLLQGFEKVIQGLRVRGSWRPNRNFNIFTPTLMAGNVVSFSFSWCSTGCPEANAAGSWLSLLHLISIFSGPQLIRAPMAPSAWCGFPYHILSSPSPTLTGTAWLLSWLSYIIVQHPLNRLLEIWNRMLDRRQAEITVMQFKVTLFRCVSLWVYHGNFLPRPISSANFRPRDFLS